MHYTVRNALASRVETLIVDGGGLVPEVVAVCTDQRKAEAIADAINYRVRLADKLRADAADLFAKHGPQDPRGAAFWDVAVWLEES